MTHILPAAHTTPTLFTVDEAAEILRCSAYFVRDELKRKQLRGSKIGREWRIKPADLDTYVEARMNLARVRRPR